MPHNDIVPFAFEGVEVRTLLINDEPWWVAADVATALGIANGRNMVARLDDDEKGVRLLDTPGGPQNLTVINEPGLYSAVLRSDSRRAEPFKRWVRREVLPAIRKTGSYSVAEKTPMQIIRDQHASIAILLEENESLTARAVQAEATVNIIEGGAGLSIRQFHKQYFSNVSERELNDLLYRKRLLIDQRGSRGRDDHGRLRNGKEHRHPTWLGKPYFFLDPTVDRDTGERYYQTKVLPGRPEVELVELLERYGLRANRNSVRVLEAVTA